jgi:plastocyanin domain-containing protein
MKIKKEHLSKFLFVIIVFPILLILGIIFVLQGQENIQADTKFENGKQIIEFTAKNGYSPNVINAKAGVESIIRIKTINTYDCTGFLNMPKAGIINTTLKPTGINEFLLAPQKPGEVIRGSCSTGANIIELRFV